jgi:hypothetical protein
MPSKFIGNISPSTSHKTPSIRCNFGILAINFIVHSFINQFDKKGIVKTNNIFLSNKE